MTGVEFVQSSPGNQKAGLFFSKCLNNKLTTQEIMHRSDGNTSLKLSILKEIVNIHKSARMIGDFNEGHSTKQNKLYRNRVYCGVANFLDIFQLQWILLSRI